MITRVNFFFNGNRVTLNEVSALPQSACKALTEKINQLKAIDGDIIFYNEQIDLDIISIDETKANVEFANWPLLSEDLQMAIQNVVL